MKRKITKILAALALLVFTMPSLVAWGQTKDEVLVYTLDGTKTGGTNNYASESDITQNDISWKVMANTTENPWRFGGKSITEVDRPAYTTEALSSDNITKVVITTGTATATVNSIKLIVSTNSNFSDATELTESWQPSSTITFNKPTTDDWTSKYFKIVFNITVSGSSNKYAQFVKAEFYKETGTTLQDSDLSLSPTALSFDLYDDAEAKTITISTSSTGAISVSNNAYVTTQVNGVASITVTPVAVTPEAQTITVSQAADNTYNAGEATFTVSVANSTPQYTVSYKANGGTGDDIIDTYYQGEDVTIRSNTFVYTGHAFTKWNTLANGTGTDYQPADIIEDIQANVELYAQWEESNEVVDVLTNSNTIGETTNNYGDWTTTGTSGAEYSGNSAGGNGTIQLRSNNNSSGIVSTTSGGLVKKVVVTWYSGTSSGRTLNVYGNNTAYTAASDLYGDNAGTLLGTIVMGTSTELTINDDYEYIGLRSASGAMYLEDIHITWEPDNNPAVATTVTINVPEGFNTDIYQGTTAGTLTATVTAGDEAISGATVTWESSNETVATIDANGAVTLVAVGTTTITANYAGVDGEYRPSSGTYELNVIDSHAPGAENNPYTVAQARAAIDAGSGTQGVYVTGIVSENNYFSQNNGYITYFISDDGSTESDQLEAFHGMSYNGEAFTSADDIQVGDIVVIHGDLTKYNDIYEFAAGNQLVSLERPTSTDPSITVTPATVSWNADFHEVCTLEISHENYGELQFNPAVMECNANGEAFDYDWLSAYIVENNVQYGVLANEGGARTAYLKVYDTELEGVEFIVTINQAAYEAPSLTGTITFGTAEGSTSINSTSVTGEDSMGNTWTITTTFEGDESFTPQPGYAQVGSSKKPASSITFTTTLPEEKTIASFEAKFGGFGGTTGDINLYVGEELVGTGFLNETEDVIVESTETATGTELTVTVTDIAKGVKCYYISYTLEEEAPAGYTYSVNGYGSSDGGYVLMATPTAASVDPASVGMITDQLGANVTPETSTYDLYYYDQAQDKEWRNYRAQSFELEPGKGYLYASKDGVTLTFTGELNPTFTDVTLPYTEGNAIKSLYLAGNSSTEAQTFYVYDNDLALQTVNFLTMNSNGDGFTTTTATSLTAEPMQGFFVQAAGSNWTLSTAELSNGNNSNQGVSLININVMRDRGNVIDNAIVNFSEGSMMNKFYLRDNTTRVYIPQGNEEMAVVSSAAEAEMPVSFKAAENGTYTLAVETENVEMNYLHLIDNMTGMDIDLLQTPSYTFEAKTNDYTSRFRLVFKASSTSSEADETFAYFNGSNWTVSNLGEATLQVVDVMGRLVSSETINGNATISLNQTPGVYMLRLVNGNSVKVQKVVVR